ncbi:hypothetical protein MKZ38_003033 [Zalerion maritima]|uniref:Metallo-beta-lactamase domain-containing protein n=1 Tax=Zalerion maritima TaxID=339359 RepID=A0AAD5RNA3_9PEZI|nr:hypothetical protein MKZ38_003033 [Zalerion maritima]
MSSIISIFLESLTAGKLFVAAAVFFVISLFFELVVLTPTYPNLPTVGHGRGIVGSARNLIDYPANFSKWILEGYEKYGANGKSFVTPRILSKPPDIVLPQSQTMWMLNQPDHVLSIVAAHESTLRTGYNFLDPAFVDSDFHSKVIHKNLARSLNKLIPTMQEEVAYAVDKAFGTDPDEWRHINIWDAWLTIIPIVTNRMLVGEPLNRNDEYLSWMVKFTNLLIRNNLILNLTPKVLHPIVARILTIDNWRYWKKSSRLTLPLIKERQHALERKDAGDPDFVKYQPPDDYISWTLKLAKKEGNAHEWNPTMVSKRLLPINFAAIHTTALTGHSLCLDLFSTDPAKGYVLGIRDELARVFADEGGQWTKAGLQKLYKTDSSIRESQRCSNFSATLVERMVVADEGITNETEGWHAPKGTYTVLNYSGVHHSKQLYGDDPNEYDAFRFSRQREESAAREGTDPAETLKMAKMGMVTTSENHFPFGHGRHTCKTQPVSHDKESREPEAILQQPVNLKGDSIAMSTFNGIVHEFPDIRVDFFRLHQDRPPPLACFLSHIHSDHLAGLESLKSPFVYCSPATREMLLRLEKYPARILLAKGVIEARKQTFKHLRNILKPLPLETPVTLKLSPGNSLQVTLLDANHCPGSVMFLFESPSAAALYTGDMRSEPWWVNTIIRSPCLTQYVAGLRVLDTLYIDNSFTDDINFETKSEGLQELLTKVAKYPPETIFYVQAWTYGYEEVWIALAKALNSRIHVDEYKHRMYTCLRTQSSRDQFSPSFHHTKEAPALIGFRCGNTDHPGCLTERTDVRIHSCEKGNVCDIVKNNPVVTIQPVVTRLPSGRSVTEVGVGGGGDDLEREVEISAQELGNFLDTIKNKEVPVPDDLLPTLHSVLANTQRVGRPLGLDFDVDNLNDQSETTVREALDSLLSRIRENASNRLPKAGPSEADLPKFITFPYARHSSWGEQCHLVHSLKPRDVWPCTVDPKQWIQEGTSIAKLYGPFCSGKTFKHDVDIQEGALSLANNTQHGQSQHSQATNASFDDDLNTSSTDPPQSVDSDPPKMVGTGEIPASKKIEVIVIQDDSQSDTSVNTTQLSLQVQTSKRSFHEFSADVSVATSELEGPTKHVFVDETHELDTWDRAYSTMVHNMFASGSSWSPLGLLSTTDNHTVEDRDLGNIINQAVVVAVGLEKEWSYFFPTVALGMPVQSLDFKGHGGKPCVSDSLVGYLGAFFLSADPYVYFYLSDRNNPTSFTALNDGDPVMTPTEGTGGVRDPATVVGGRDEVGKKWHILGTGLNISEDVAVRQGSKGIFVWESTDLVNWVDERLVVVKNESAAMASKFSSSNDTEHTGDASPIYFRYAYISDFQISSEPQTYIDKSPIDGTALNMLPMGDNNYVRFTKDETLKTAFC